jgi:hypothetical protein
MHSVSLKQLLTEQLPVLLVSMLIAELFYKFHSFTLETIAFLGTWFVLDFLVSQVTRRLAKKRETSRQL